MADLAPIEYPNVGRPFYAASGRYGSATELLTFLEFCPTASYYHIQSIVFGFSFAVEDLTNAAILNTVDQFGVPTVMTELSQITSVDPITTNTCQMWENEVEFDTCAGFGIWLANSGDSDCWCTIFGWQVLWNPLVA